MHTNARTPWCYQLRIPETVWAPALEIGFDSALWPMRIGDTHIFWSIMLKSLSAQKWSCKAWRQLSAVFFIMQVYRFTWQFICPNWVTGGVWVAKISPACNKNIVDPTNYFYCNRDWASINSTSCRKYLPNYRPRLSRLSSAIPSGKPINAAIGGYHVLIII